jgi:hypothetical protein
LLDLDLGDRIHVRPGGGDSRPAQADAVRKIIVYRLRWKNGGGVATFAYPHGMGWVADIEHMRP